MSIKSTEKFKLMQWCEEKHLFSKADLMRYGCDNYYLRAWRTGCDFVTEGLARKLTKIECKERNLTTSMGWYAWIGDPARTENEEAVSQNNLAAETRINERQLEFAH